MQRAIVGEGGATLCITDVAMPGGVLGNPPASDILQQAAPLGGALVPLFPPAHPTDRPPTSGRGGNPYFTFANSKRQALKLALGRVLTKDELDNLQVEIRTEWDEMPPEQKAAGSNPAGGTLALQGVSAVFSGYRCTGVTMTGK